MPAVSKAQQRLMGIAYAFKKGEIPEDEVSDEVKDLADSMSLKKLKSYASTKHDDLPDKVDEKSDYIQLKSPFRKYTVIVTKNDYQRYLNGKDVTGVDLINQEDVWVLHSDKWEKIKESSGVFKNRIKMFPFQAAILAHNWKKKGYFTVIEEDEYENEVEVWGYRKDGRPGETHADWKYISDEYILMHDLKSKELFDLTTEPKGEKIKPIIEAANATLGNTPGMESSSFPGDPGAQTDFVNQEPGSGDIPGGDLPDEDEEDEDENYFGHKKSNVYSQKAEHPVAVQNDSLFKKFEQFISEGVKKEKLPVKVTIEKNWAGYYSIQIPAGKMTWDTFDDLTTRDNRMTFQTYDYETGEAQIGTFDTEKEAKEIIKKFKSYIKL